MTEAHPQEGDVKAEIKRLFHAHGWMTWMPPANTYGASGQSDHLAVRKCGAGHLFMAVEAKLKKEHGTVNQERFLADVRDQGALGLVVNQDRLPQFEAILQAISRAYPHRYWHEEGLGVHLTASIEVPPFEPGLPLFEVDRAEYDRLKMMYRGESALRPSDEGRKHGDYGWTGSPPKRESPPPGGAAGSTTSVEQGGSQDRSEEPIPAATKGDKGGQKQPRTKAAAGKPSRGPRKPRKGSA